MGALEIRTLTTIVWRYSKVFMKGVYLLHFFPRLFGMAVFLIYKTQCAIKEKALIFDCAQESPVASPKDWILYWLVCSILSSVAFYFICCSHVLQRYKRQRYKNMNFWILMMLFLVTTASFSLEMIYTELKDMPLFLALFLWWPSTFAQIIYLNNQPPAQYPYNRPQCRDCNRLQNTGSAEFIGRPCNHRNQGNTLWFYLVYYTSLITHCLECCAMAWAITLDVVGELIPVAVVHGDVYGRLFTYVTEVFVLTRLGCVYCILLLYFQKLLQGDRRLFPISGEELEQ